MRHAIVIALLLAALAGCLQSGPPDDGGDVDPRVMQQPTWTPGETWTVTLSAPGFDDETVDLVYAWDQPVPEPGVKHYMLGGPHDHAVFHAIFDVNPFLGRIHSDVLAPHEDGTHASQYRFPLEPPQEEWEERPGQVYFGKHRSFTATYSEEVPSPSGPTEGYELVAEADDGSVVEYNYVPEVKWWTQLSVRDADGEEIVGLTLEDHGTGGSGVQHFVRSRVLGTVDDTYDTGVGQTETFDLTYDPDDRSAYGTFDLVALGIRVAPQGDLGRVDLSVQDPDGEERWSGTVTSDQGNTNTVAEIAPQGDAPKEGTWTIEMDVLESADVTLEAVGGWEYCGQDGEETQCPSL